MSSITVYVINHIYLLCDIMGECLTNYYENNIKDGYNWATVFHLISRF